MSDEPKCLCGHIADEHMNGDGPCYSCVGTAHCYYFHTVLSWPDAEGWWWFQSLDKDFESGAGLLFFFTDDEYGLVAWAGDGDLSDATTWELHYGRSRFTRLLEQNPFTEQA